VYCDEYTTRGDQSTCGVSTMRDNEHVEDEDGGGVWWEVLDTVLTIIICTVGASVVAWACLEALMWADRMGWL